MSFSREKLDEFERWIKTLETIKRHYDEFRQDITRKRADKDIVYLETEL